MKNLMKSFYTFIGYIMLKKITAIANILEMTK